MWTTYCNLICISIGKSSDLNNSFTCRQQRKSIEWPSFLPFHRFVRLCVNISIYFASICVWPHDVRGINRIEMVDSSHAPLVALSALGLPLVTGRVYVWWHTEGTHHGTEGTLERTQGTRQGTQGTQEGTTEMCRILHRNRGRFKSS